MFYAFFSRVYDDLLFSISYNSLLVITKQVNIGMRTLRQNNVWSLNFVIDLSLKIN